MKLMKCFLSTVLAIYCASICNAQAPQNDRKSDTATNKDVLVSGRIVDSANNAIGGVTVSILILGNASPLGSARSDSKTGEYKLTLQAPEEFDILFIHSGYDFAGVTCLAQSEQRLSKVLYRKGEKRSLAAIHDHIQAVDRANFLAVKMDQSSRSKFLKQIVIMNDTFGHDLSSANISDRDNANASIEDKNHSNETVNLLRNRIVQVNKIYTSLSGSEAGQKIEVATPELPRTGRPDQAGQKWESAERTLATYLAIDNQEDLALAMFAADKVQSEDVKSFAEIIVKEYSQFLQKLQKFTPEAGMRNIAEQTSEPRSVQPANRQNTRPDSIQQTTGTVPNGRPLDLIQVRRELAQENLAASKKELSEKGDDTDECFIRIQIAKQVSMKNKLAVLQRHASGELKQLIADIADSTDKHLNKAQEIMKSLDSSYSKSSRRGERPEKQK